MSRMSLKFGKIQLWAGELIALERLKKIPVERIVVNMVVNIIAPSFLVGSSSFLQESRTCIKAWMSVNIDKFPPQTTELPVLERLKNQCIML